MRNRIKYSQNFLQDPHLVRHLLKKSSICANDIVYEIGAGEGIITQELLKKAKKVIAFELDKNFTEKLNRLFQNRKNLEIKAADFLTCDLPDYPYKVFSNIPFKITSAIMKKLTLADNPPNDAYLIVQAEAAAKFAGRPLDQKNSQIAVRLYPWFELRVLYRFTANDFFPRPNVDIILIQIKKRDKPLIKTQDKHQYEDFIAYTFNRFKPNILEGLSGILGKTNILHLAKETNFLPNSKPSELNFADWLALYKLFLKSPIKSQSLIKGAYAQQLKQEGRLEKIHRTRIAKNWKNQLK